MKSESQIEMAAICHNFPSYLLSDASSRAAFAANLLKPFLRNRLISKLGNLSHLLNIPSRFGRFFRAFASRSFDIMQRTLAPLRRIAARDIEVLAYSRVHSERPSSFLIHDLLECGHTKTLMSWALVDLLHAYTDNPQVSAKRHRCIPCAQLVLTRKPMATVGVAAKAAVIA